jgi:pimeloyl-ACP methyl ester carboxylesterase
MRRMTRTTLGLAAAGGALLLNRHLVDRETKPAQAGAGRLVGTTLGELHVLEEGDPAAPPAVLLHGFAGSLHWFDRLAPLLAGEHRIIRFDLLGHGGSTKGPGGVSIEQQAQAVEEALAELGVESALFVGHSYGAAVSVAVAERGGSLVERLVNLDEGPNDDDFGQVPLLARIGLYPVIGELFHRVAIDSLVRDGYSDAFGDDFDMAGGFHDPDQVVHDYRAMTFTSYRECWNGELAFLNSRRLDERLRDVGVPALVVFGDQDRFFLGRESADAFRQVPNARVELLAGVGHSPNVECPDEVARLVREFAATAAA